MFFDNSSFAEPKLSMEHFKEWATEIANSYIGSGTPPTETLLKVASSEELTPHQIEVLAGETNKIIHQVKYAKVEDKYHAADFPLADAKAVIAKLQVDGGQLKLAVEIPEPKFTDEGPDAYKMFGVEPEQIDKTASVRYDLKVASQKTELLNNKLDDEEFLSKVAVEDAETKFIKLARQMMLSENSSLQRMKVLGQIDHFVKCASMEDIAKKPLAKLAYVLSKEGLLEPTHAKKAIDYFMSKEAGLPEDLISETLQAKVVNGTHPLYITLKTLQDSHHNWCLAKDRHQLVDDQLKIVGQKIRAL